ncbi:MAG: hypothetical protein ACTSVE_12475, partial [Candidatus Helarchaeota archaeon]
FLWIGLKAVDSDNDSFGSAFVTQIIFVLVGWIPCLGCIIQLWAIHSRHETSWGGAIVVWLLAAFLPIIVLGIIIFFAFPVVSGSLWAFFGALAPTS